MYVRQFSIFFVLYGRFRAEQVVQNVGIGLTKLSVARPNHSEDVFFQKIKRFVDCFRFARLEANLAAHEI